jgi:hypothetical protein
MTIRFRRYATLAAVLATMPLLSACGDGDRDRLASAPAPAGLPVPAAASPAGQAPAQPAAPMQMAASAGDAAYERVIQVYKTPTCGCCTAWVDHVKDAGFEVEVLDLPDLTAIKTQQGIPRELASCHTSVVGGYWVEGHVPADLIARLLRDKPAIRGISVPGMPMGSPGMEGPYREKYNVIAVGRDGSHTVYDTRQ